MKNLLVGGVFSAQTPDTSGEILDIKGADISDLKTGKAPVNTEHINPEDVKEANKDPKIKGFEGFQTIVGRVVTAKKIFSEADCENEQEKRAWNNLKVPLIWGILEIFDDADHPNAKAAAAIIKSYHNAGVDQLLGYSVEGATLKRDGKHLLETCIRKIALTAKPCNKASKVEFIQDSPAGVSKSMNEQAAGAGLEPLYKTAYNSQVYILDQPVKSRIKDHGLANAFKELKKTLDAGGGNAAPSALSGGAALQKESELGKLLRTFKKMKPMLKPTKEAIRKHCPTLSDDDLEKVEAVLLAKFEEETLKLTEGIYADLTKIH